ncbi:TadE/TadG family type IV pilus assembly protein [Occallatibacter savannae]|uniref:TadE/TadG family type IV pilus assembly protein n=1 Tax=Occallatibacter savannae TaxID=1002691 RepID=UPI001EF52E06|nr:TadE/TadG family type IV pilus assembly protein [Occallatibacter savannae]
MNIRTRSARTIALMDAEGASFVELALVLPLFFLMLIPVVDIGRGFYASIEVSSAAHSGAMYGLENPSDTAGMIQAAKAGASNLSDVSATAKYGCECSDGTSAVDSCTTTPTCTYNYVTYVDVSVTSAYKTVFGYPGLPSSMNITREFRLRPGGD